MLAIRRLLHHSGPARWLMERIGRALFPKSTINQQLPQPLVTATLGAF